MNKKTKITIISVICAAVIVCAVVALLLFRGGKDENLYKNFDENEQYQLEKNGAKKYSSPVLVIYGQEDELIGVTQLGNKVYLDNPDNISIKQGNVVSKLNITVGDDGVRRGKLNYPFTANLNLPVYCSQSEAPAKMVETRMKNFMNSPGYAGIREYKINSITEKKIDSGEEGTAIINFTLNCDVKPTEFAQVYGFPGDDGWCRDLEYDYAIWGTNETWYLLGEDPIHELTGSYLVNEKIWEENELFRDDRYMVKSACFETPNQSIITDLPLGSEDEYGEDIDITNLDDYDEENINHYYTELYAVDANNGSKIVIEHGMKNLQYDYITSRNTKAYMRTTEWGSGGQVNPSYFLCFDMATMKLTRLFDKCVILGITDTTLYAHGEDLNDGTQNVYAVDLETGKTKWVTAHQIPVTDQNPIVEQGVYDGYVHVMYAEHKVVFKFDETTGALSFGYAG